MARRLTPRVSVTVWRLTFLWLDLWSNRCGLDVEWEGPMWTYSLAVGFGDGVKARRSRS